mgnify:CR=1 FL=1
MSEISYKNYEEVMNRIIEIIDLSEEKLKEIEAKDYNEYFINICWKDIYKEYANEFRNLLDSERTMHLYNTLDYKNENIKLLDMCSNLIRNHHPNAQKYAEIIRLLNNSNGKRVDELIEYHGYFVLKSDFELFHDLVQELENQKLTTGKDISEIQDNFDKSREQLKRINNAIQNQNEKKDSSSLDEVVIDTLIKLRNRYSKEEYEEILSKLQNSGTLNDNQINEIKNAISLESQNINNIDELVSYFALQTDFKESVNFVKLLDLINSVGGMSNFLDFIINLYDKLYDEGIKDEKEYVNIGMLKDLIPYIERDGYSYIINQLFLKNKVSWDDFLEDMSNIEKKH